MEVEEQSQTKVNLENQGVGTPPLWIERFLDIINSELIFAENILKYYSVEAIEEAVE